MRTLLRAALAVVALGVCAPAARALPQPDLLFAAGSSFAVNGTPNGGGLSGAVSPMWQVSDGFAFGFTLFADDMGTTIGRLVDPHDGVDLGAVALAHRFAWGGAWRADGRLATRGAWDFDGTGEWGWWRLQDDQRGQVSGAVSTIGLGAGLGVHRLVHHQQSVGLALRYRQLFTGHSVAWHDVNHYATAALEWRWAAARDDRP